MTTYATLSGNVADLVGADFDARTTKVWVEANVDRLVDTDAGQVRLGVGLNSGTGDTHVNLDGTFTFAELIATGSTGTNLEDSSLLQYRVWVSYYRPSDEHQHLEKFGWYAVSADADVADLVEVEVLEVAYASAFLAQAEAILAAQIALSGIDTSDELVSTLVTDPALGPLTQAALAVAVDAEVDPLRNLTDPVLVAALSASIADTTPGAWGATLMQTYAQDDGRINGNDKRLGAPGLRATLVNALDAAEAVGKHTVVELARVWDVENGLSLSGRSAVLRGHGAGGTMAAPQGTVLHASTQTGPVLDYSGWVLPANFSGKVTHGGFLVRGSGLADPTKACSGMKFTALSSVTFADIAIRDTGGPCLEGASNPGNAVYLSDFERIILARPAGADVNDVPFMIFNEPNGNRFRGIGLYGGSQVIGASGAVRIVGNANYTGHDTILDSFWIEALYAPNGGTLVEVAANGMVLSNFQFFDCRKDLAGSTGTSYFRLQTPAVSNFGGNQITGLIPGRGTNATDLDCGIDMRQGRNAVVGVKGYRGINVVIAAGIADTHVDLRGASSTATDAAVVDNSGLKTTVVTDRSQRIAPAYGRNYRQIVTGRFYGPTGYIPGTCTNALNRLTAVPIFLPAQTPIDQLLCEVTTAASAGSTVRLGIYLPANTFDYPTTLLLDAGTIDATTAGIKTLPVSAVLPAGIVYLAAVSQGGAAVTLRSVGTEALPPVPQLSFGGGQNGFYVDAVSGALNGAWGSASPFSGAPKIMFRAL